MSIDELSKCSITRAPNSSRGPDASCGIAHTTVKSSTTTATVSWSPNRHTCRLLLLLPSAMTSETAPRNVTTPVSMKGPDEGENLSTDS